MKIQIDLKSAVLGLLLGAGVLFSVAAVSETPRGKYQVDVGQNIAVIVDTQTGESWGIDLTRALGDNKPDRFWQPKN